MRPCAQLAHGFGQRFMNGIRVDGLSSELTALRLVVACRQWALCVRACSCLCLPVPTPAR